MRERLRVEIRGAVQGVGFRPFVHRLATGMGLAGWVTNDVRGVEIEVEGPRDVLEAFLVRLEQERPAHARVLSTGHEWLATAGFERFEIRASEETGAKSAAMLPEIATCPACLAEVCDPADRRHRYPFANCTQCGPRFTIIRTLPYDRPHTTMSGFPLCPDCLAEYRNPADRRFHAQPIACPACGPQLELFDAAGAVIARRDDALRAAAAALREGRTVAVKGLGGFHLLCDAADAAAVARLRERKPRFDKPFALMARDLAQAGTLVRVDEEAARALASPEAPIVLLPRIEAGPADANVLPGRSTGARPGVPTGGSCAPVAANVAPGHPTLGVMLPATPLHHLLLAEAGIPVVATSGNLSDEPIATDGAEARARLGHVAELFLDHDRPIERHVDDSVGWLVRGGFALLRRARGWAPLPVPLARPWPTVLAVGAHLKNTVALSLGPQVFLSQHIGDLETPEAIAAFERVIHDFLRLYEAAPAAVAHDLHPDYASSQWARAAAGVPGRRIAVQHHHAHLASCLAEHGVDGPALGVIWDGTGHGPDGTVWGGEFLLGGAAGYERVGHLHPFRLPGGEAAVREPRRTAVAMLWELLGTPALERTDLAPVASFTERERAVIGRMLQTGVRAPVTTSAGRLFDGVAALLGLGGRVTYEAQAAAALEFTAARTETGSHPVEFRDGAVVDWRPTLAAVLDDLAAGVPRDVISARFHRAMIGAILAVARHTGVRRVVLSGGCFQNRLLLEGVAAGLEAAGHEVLTHRLVPPNDGGVSLGQAAVAAAVMEKEACG